MAMFSFGYKKYDFWDIYESIKKYNPIGIKKASDGLFHSYPGLEALAAIINDNMLIEENFKTRWVDFERELQTKINQPITGTTYGRAPSFSSYVEIEKITLQELTRLKELHFMVSVVGKFYTVIGHDRNEIRINKKNYCSSNCLIISPENEYTATFAFLCEEIENRFKGYRFIPFNINAQTVEGLDVSYTDENLNTVYHALFNNHIKDLNIRVIGNDSYKMDEWIKKDYVEREGGWTIYPPTTPVI